MNTDTNKLAPDRGTLVSLLRAMAINYMRFGAKHCFDHLDADACMRTADALDQQLSGNSGALCRLLPPEWLSECVGGRFDDLSPGQAWREGFNECRERVRLLIEQHERLSQTAPPAPPAQAVPDDVRTLRIEASQGLDPITVHLDFWGVGRGRATIACYGSAWTACWTAMGSRSILEFISSIDPEYMAGNMLTFVRHTKRDREYVVRVAAAVIAEAKRVVSLAAPGAQEVQK